MKYDCDVKLKFLGTTKFIEKDDEVVGRYISEGVVRALLGGHNDSELFGEHGLFAVTMKCVDCLSQIEDVVNDPMPASMLVERIRNIMRGN